MALDDFIISTGVDQLIRLVKERGRVEVGAAASALSLPIKTVEDWAHVLEGEGIVSIEYRLTKIYIVWKEPSKEYVAEKSQKLAAKASSAKAEIDRLLAKVQTEGKELSQMQHELEAIGGVKLSPEESERLRKEIAQLEDDFSAKAKAASEKLLRLGKRAKEAAGRKGGPVPEKKKEALAELERELAVLHRFEDTLFAQQNEADEKFSKLEVDIERLRLKLSDGASERLANELRSEIANAVALKGEILGAVEALAEETAVLYSKISGLESRVQSIVEGEGSVSGLKRKLAELRRISEEAKGQRGAAKERLEDTAALVRKQTARISAILQREGGASASEEGMKNEYVDISEEAARAVEELAKRQSAISARLAQQKAAIAAGRLAPQGRFNAEEIEKVAFLLRELRHEQNTLEEKVKLLAKETEILAIESVPLPPAQAAAMAVGAVAQPAGGESGLVERIRISQDDEAEFEKKRSELRSLIRKMWEESKSGRGS